MDEQRAWLKSRRRKRLRLLAVALCCSLLVTTYPDMLTTLSVLAAGLQGEDSADIVITGFSSLPEDVREQTVPLGTTIEELNLPDTLEAYVAKKGAENEWGGEKPPKEEEPDGDKDDKDKEDKESGGTSEGDGTDGSGSSGNNGGEGEESGEASGEGDGESGETSGESDSNDGGTEGSSEGISDGSGSDAVGIDGGAETGGSGSDAVGTDGGAENGDSDTTDVGTEGAAPASSDTADSTAAVGFSTETGFFVMPVYASENPQGGMTAGILTDGADGTTAAPADGAGTQTGAGDTGSTGTQTQTGTGTTAAPADDTTDAETDSTADAREDRVTIGNVTWESNPAYDGNVEGTYTFTAVLPEGYALSEGVSLPQITVTTGDSIDAVIQTLLDRIAALPDAQEYMEKEPDIDSWEGDEDDYEEAYAEWMEGLQDYAGEALAILEEIEEIEKLTEEEQALLPQEALEKLTAWVEIAKTLSESAMVMAAADGSHGDHSGWTAIGSSTITMTAGKKYYLARDVQVYQEIQVTGGEVTLCLNGYSLRRGGADASNWVITVAAGATLNVYDCSDEGKGTIESAPSYGRTIGGGISVSGTLNVYGGVIKGKCDGYQYQNKDNLDSLSYSAGICAQADSVVNLYGGTVQGTGSSGVYVAKGAKLTVDGAAVTSQTNERNNNVMIAAIYIEGGAAEINSGEVSLTSGVNNCVSIDVCPGGSLTVNGGVVSSGTGWCIMVRKSYQHTSSEAAHALINDGTVSGRMSVGSGMSAKVTGGSLGSVTLQGGVLEMPDRQDIQQGSAKAAIFILCDNFEYAPERNATGKIKLTGALTSPEPYTVALSEVNPTSAYPLIITEGFGSYMSGEKPADYFTSIEGYKVILQDGEAALRPGVITFDANGGACDIQEGDIRVGDSLGGNPLRELPTPTREHYSFDGWYTQKAGGDKIDLKALPSDEDITVYAHWTADTYKVTFDYQDATGGNSTADKDVAYDGTYGDLPAPTRTGYAFAGWYTAASGGTKVTNTTKVTRTSDHTLYARWTANGYKVKYDGNGSTGGSTADSTHTYGTAKALTANGYTRSYTVTFNHNYAGSANTAKTASYTFAGWNTASDGSGDSYSDKQSVSNLTSTKGGTVTLYAQWTPGSVTYSPARTGYTFAGWYTGSSCSGSRVDNSGAYTPTAGSTLYAKWTANTYKVTFNYQNATGGNSTASKNVIYDGTYGDLPAPTRTGYAFKGWFTQAGGQGSLVTDTTTVTITSGQTLYAYWKDEEKPDTPVLQSGVSLPGDWTKTQTTIPLTLYDSVGVTELWVIIDAGEPTKVSGFTGGSGTLAYRYAVLEGDHTYQFMAKDAAGNTSDTSVGFRVKLDTEAPVFSTDPTVKNITSDSADITVTPSEGGKMYWIVDPAEAPDSALAVVTGAQASADSKGGVVGITGGSPVDIAITGLTPRAAHRVYVALEDAAGNLSEVKEIAFATLAEAPVVTLDDLDKDYDNERVKVPEKFGKVEAYTDPGNPSGSVITPDDDGFLPVEPGTPIYIRYPAKTEEGVDIPASGGTRIDIPARPDAPPAKEAAVTDTTVTVMNPAAGEEYILVPKGQEPDWSDTDKVNETGAFTGLDPDTEYDLYVKKKATEDAFTSEPAKTGVCTYVTINEPTVTGDGAGKDGNTAPRPDKPDEGGSTITYTGTYGEEYTPVIKVDGKEIIPGGGTPDGEDSGMTWKEEDGEGEWKYVYPIPGGVSETEITVEFRKRVVTGITAAPERLTVFADDAVNWDAEEAGDVEPLTAYLKEKCSVEAAYDNRTIEEVQADAAVYTTADGFAPKGGTYRYTVSMAGKTAGITLTVNPVDARAITPDGLVRVKKPGGYTEGEVAAWLPAKVTVDYTGTGYTSRQEDRTVTWDMASTGSGFGAQTGKKTISGTVDLPAWATGDGAVGMEIEFIDKYVLTDSQMQLSVPDSEYGDGLPEPQGSVTVADTNPFYDWRYSADGGATWVAADHLPKSGSGHVVPGGYKVKMTYTGDSYTGAKEASFTVTKKTATAGKGTLEAVSRKYDGTTDAVLKEGGAPVLSGVVEGDDVELGGTLEAHFAEKGPKKNITVTVTGFGLEGVDSICYELGNTTITLYATISKASSGGNNGSSGNSGNSGGGDNGSGGNGGNSGGDNGSGGNGGNSGGDNGSGGNGGNGKPGNGTQPGDGMKPGNGTQPGDGTKPGNGTQPGDGTKPGNGTQPDDGTKPGNGTQPGDGTKPGDSTKPDDGTKPDNGMKPGDGTQPDDGTQPGDGTKPNDGTQPEDGTNPGGGIPPIGEDVLIVPVMIEDSRIVIDDGTGGTSTGGSSGAGSTGTGDTGTGGAGGTGTDGANGGNGTNGGSIATGNVPGMAGAGTDTHNGESTMRTMLKMGEGAVFVTVVCKGQDYTAGVADTLAVANATLAPEQIQCVSEGKTVEIRIDVTDISDQMTPQNKEVMESAAAVYRNELPELAMGMYVDISVYIRVGEGGWNTVSKTKEPIDVVIGIPEELRSEGRTYYIIRAHAGEYTLLEDTDDTPDTITIRSDRFSSYAIAYQQTGGTGADAKCGLCHICPAFLGVCCFIWLAVILAVAGIVIFVVLWRRRREEQEGKNKN